jgi:hypothetical protein
MMTKGSRILVLVAALALGLVYVLPVWKISLQAPQYPEGLGMVIRINTIVGVKQHDLDNINNLNHYIGMKRIEPESIPEMRIMPAVIGAFVLLGLLTAALGRRKVLYGYVGAFLVFALVGMADFWKWEYDYGHDLDQENAIIKIPGMSYQPPLIGSRQILNFKAHSWPGAGGWILIGFGALGTGLVLIEAGRARPGRRGREGPRRGRRRHGDRRAPPRRSRAPWMRGPGAAPRGLRRRCVRVVPDGRRRRRARGRARDPYGSRVRLRLGGVPRVLRGLPGRPGPGALHVGHGLLRSGGDGQGRGGLLPEEPDARLAHGARPHGLRPRRGP